MPSISFFDCPTLFTHDILGGWDPAISTACVRVVAYRHHFLL